MVLHGNVVPLSCGVLVSVWYPSPGVVWRIGLPLFWCCLDAWSSSLACCVVDWSPSVMVSRGSLVPLSQCFVGLHTKTIWPKMALFSDGNRAVFGQMVFASDENLKHVVSTASRPSVFQIALSKGFANIPHIPPPLWDTERAQMRVAVWCPSLRVLGGSLIPRSLAVAWLLGPPLLWCWVAALFPALMVLHGSLVPLS